MGNDRPIDGSLALQGRMPKIITIEASEHPRIAKLRVAAYIRVSTNSLDQEHSFAAQNSYYTSLVANTKAWTLVDIYADDGITGTSTEKRDDFNRLIADCRRGLIDRILCKSISRFARNTKDCLEAIRELKALGISVFFEEQNIDTASMSSEMIIAFLSSSAQQESQAMSHRVRWGFRRRMEAGTFNTCRAPYGFRLDHGELVVNEEEAETVRYIFQAYLSGESIRDIAAQLAKRNQGKRTWCRQSVEYILQNERYMGNALLMKRYATDTLPHKMKWNKGERQMYLVEGSNDAIVAKEVFEQAQELRRKRIEKRPSPSGIEKPLAKMIRCEKCGCIFRHKTIQGIRYWSCKAHAEGAILCQTTPIPESQFYGAFLRLYYNLKHSDILTHVFANLCTIRERRLLWREDIIDLNKKISELSSQNLMLAELKKHGLIDPDIFIAQANELAQQLRAAKQEKERLLSSMADDSIEQTKAIVEVINDGPDFLDDFDPDLFGDLIEQIIVEDNEHIRFRLKNGLELPETIERTMR